VTINSVNYSSNIATLNLNGGAALPPGVYRFFVCSTVSVPALDGTTMARAGMILSGTSS